MKRVWRRSVSSWKFQFPIICDQSFHGTILEDAVREGVDKLLEVLDTIYITNQCSMSTEELSHGSAVINSQGVTHDCVSCNCLVALGNVEDRVVGLEVFLDVIIGKNCSSIVTDDLICCLEDFFRLKTKVGS